MCLDFDVYFCRLGEQWDFSRNERLLHLQRIFENLFVDRRMQTLLNILPASWMVTSPSYAAQQLCCQRGTHCHASPRLLDHSAATSQR